MARRELTRQGSLGDWLLPDHEALHTLDGLDAVVDWSALERLCAPIYASKEGRRSAPIEVLLRALLLGAWHGLSDVKLEASLARDLLFRRFCRLGWEERGPDQTTLSRFRQQLVLHGVWEQLLEEVNRQLAAQGILLVSGHVSIVDATVIEAHQSRPHRDREGNSTQDPDAGWHVKGSGKTQHYTYGYSVHVNCDEDGFILKQAVTSGSVHDSQMRESLMTGTESALYADSAYASAKTDADLAARGVRNEVQRKGYRNHPLSQADVARNEEIGVTRGRVEPIFASYKLPHHRNCRKTRFLGLKANTTQFGLMAIMHNLMKAVRFVERYGLLTPLVHPQYV